MTKPAQYWRKNTEWSAWVGKTGTVIASTVLHVTSPDRAPFTPYSLVLVDFGDQKAEYMGAAHEVFASGDTVVCVLRKTAVPNDVEIIPYGIKVTHASET